VVIGKTPYGPRGCERGDEISKFFQEWQGAEIESFVILNEHADFGHFLPHLVHTRFDSGLTQNDTEMAVKIFEKYKKSAGRTALAT
jgi:hypothetical protein